MVLTMEDINPYPAIFSQWEGGGGVGVWGEVLVLISMINYTTCGFPERGEEVVRTPCPPSGYTLDSHAKSQMGLDQQQYPYSLMGLSAL